MFTKLQTCFTVFPQHTNSLSPLIFGGAFFSQMDMVAAMAVRRLLYSSPTGCREAVTHKADVLFSKPSYQTNLIFLTAEIMEVGKKSILVKVVAEREKLVEELGFTGIQLETIAEVNFVFVSILQIENMAAKPDLLPYHPHGISNEEVQEARRNS